MVNIRNLSKLKILGSRPRLLLVLRSLLVVLGGVAVEDIFCFSSNLFICYRKESGLIFIYEVYYRVDSWLVARFPA